MLLRSPADFSLKAICVGSPHCTEPLAFVHVTRAREIAATTRSRCDLASGARYEVYFGTLCDGPQEWKSGEESLWNDHLFHKWDDEVRERGHCQRHLAANFPSSNSS